MSTWGAVLLGILAALNAGVAHFVGYGYGYKDGYTEGCDDYATRWDADAAAIKANRAGGEGS